MPRARPLVLTLILTTCAGAAPPQPPATKTPPPPAPPPAPLRLAETDAAERIALDQMLASDAWPRRAIAALRLERYHDPRTDALLDDLRRDPNWHVRCYAIWILARRGVAAPDDDMFAREDDPRVWRTALRCRWPVDRERLTVGINRLGRSRSMKDRMLAIELAAASGDPVLAEEGRDRLKKVILRMDRVEAGVLAPRLAVVTGTSGMYRPTQWQRWLLKTNRSITLGRGDLVGARPLKATAIAELEPERFAALVSYIDELGERHIDLALCMDCTGSMHGELAAAQGGIDDLVDFVSSIAASVRVGLVAYRDRGDRFKTRGHDLSDDIDGVRKLLWSLSAEGGGDSREAVYEALRLAYLEMSWREANTKVLILVGDAPPHVGFGTKCVELARRGAEHELRTHVIQTEPEPVQYFAEIAEAGDGACVTLDDDDQLVVEIAGLSFGDAFAAELREFFAIDRRLCR